MPVLFQSLSLSLFLSHVSVLLILQKQRNEKQPDGSSGLILNQYAASKRTEGGGKNVEGLVKKKEHSNTSHAKIEFFGLSSVSLPLILFFSFDTKMWCIHTNTHMNTLSPVRCFSALQPLLPILEQTKTSEILYLVPQNTTKKLVCVLVCVCVCACVTSGT